MLQRSNGLIWYSARCRLLFWYARQSVLMEDDCSRVWRQFDGLWMRAHSVPLTAQDNALCSLLSPPHPYAPHTPLHIAQSRTTHTHTHTSPTALDSVTQHQDLQRCSVCCRRTKKGRFALEQALFFQGFYLCVCARVCVVSVHLMQPRRFRLSRQFGFLFHC